MSDYESYPPHVLVGDMSHWMAIDAASFADLATLQADVDFGDLSGWSPAFGTFTYITLGDASQATWDGQLWTAYSATTPQQPPTEPPPPPPTEPPPTSANTKAEIVDWLEQHGVALDDDARSQLTKAELLDVVEHVLNDDVDDPLAAVMGAADADS